MFNLKKSLFSYILCFLSCFFLLPCQTVHAAIMSDSSKVAVPISEVTLDVGQEEYLFAIPWVVATPKFKSSRSSIVSVDAIGKVTAKKPGKAIITASWKNVTIQCKVIVRTTLIELNQTSSSLECNETFQLISNTKSNSPINYKSSKPSIASVNEFGMINAKKPGESTITVSADGTKVTCKVVVKKPTVTLNHSSATLFRNESIQLEAQVSSGCTPVFKSNKSSVATVDENGIVTAKKHGVAIITATVNQVSKKCLITVKQPTISLNSYELKLTVGQSYPLSVTTNSPNPLTFSTSNPDKATISNTGVIQALSKGTVYIYVREDGVKVKCKVIINEP